MSKISKTSLIAIVFMVIFSLSGLIVSQKSPSLSSVTLIIGIIVFFITWKTEKAEGNGDGLDLKKVPGQLKDKRVLLLIMMPMFMNIICTVLANFFVPEFIEHLKGRTDFLALGKLPILIIELIIAALGEEIAWRAFFQKQLAKVIPFVPALIISSALFAICHITRGNVVVVLYDILFVFINAVFYGMIFRKTDNAYVSTLAHFLANLLGIIEVMFL
ncbi:MAG: CPBP family intramembrane metalloprotease [Roseburia sp.]|nr:CPBP family intramembrane metalloprotease [Roseburia sp.]